MFRVPGTADDDAKEYVRTHMTKLFDATNDVIAATPRKSDVKSLTDPAHFKQRKEPLENVHGAILQHWDDLKGDKALFVFIISRKFGTKTVKRPRAPAANEPPALDGKRRKVRKLLPVGEVDDVVRGMVDRCGTTVTRMCAVIRKLRQELSDARAEVAVATAATANAAYGGVEQDITDADVEALIADTAAPSPAPSEAGEIV